jgi:hypothetical protein
MMNGEESNRDGQPGTHRWWRPNTSPLCDAMMIERGFEEIPGKGGKQGRCGGGGFGLGAVLTVGLLGTCLVFCHSDKGW